MSQEQQIEKALTNGNSIASVLTEDQLNWSQTSNAPPGNSDAFSSNQHRPSFAISGSLQAQGQSKRKRNSSGSSSASSTLSCVSYKDKLVPPSERPTLLKTELPNGTAPLKEPLSEPSRRSQRAKTRKKNCTCCSFTTEIVFSQSKTVGRQTVRQKTVISRKTYLQQTTQNDEHSDAFQQQMLDMQQNRKRKSELQKLYESLHEMGSQWAQNLCPDNILKPLDIRQAASSSVFGQLPPMDKLLSPTKRLRKRAKTEKVAEAVYVKEEKCAQNDVDESAQSCSLNGVLVECKVEKLEEDAGENIEANETKDRVGFAAIPQSPENTDDLKPVELIPTVCEPLDIQVSDRFGGGDLSSTDSSSSQLSPSNREYVTQDSVVKFDCDVGSEGEMFCLLPTFFEPSSDETRAFGGCFPDVAAEVVISTCYEESEDLPVLISEDGTDSPLGADYEDPPVLQSFNDVNESTEDVSEIDDPAFELQFTVNDKVCIESHENLSEVVPPPIINHKACHNLLLRQSKRIVKKYIKYLRLKYRPLQERNCDSVNENATKADVCFDEAPSSHESDVVFQDEKTIADRKFLFCCRSKILKKYLKYLHRKMHSLKQVSAKYLYKKIKQRSRRSEVENHKPILSREENLNILLIAKSKIMRKYFLHLHRKVKPVRNFSKYQRNGALSKHNERWFSVKRKMRMLGSSSAFCKTYQQNHRHRTLFPRWNGSASSVPHRISENETENINLLGFNKSKITDKSCHFNNYDSESISEDSDDEKFIRTGDNAIKHLHRASFDNELSGSCTNYKSDELVNTSEDSNEEVATTNENLYYTTKSNLIVSDNNISIRPCENRRNLCNLNGDAYASPLRYATNVTGRGLTNNMQYCQSPKSVAKGFSRTIDFEDPLVFSCTFHYQRIRVLRSNCCTQVVLKYSKRCHTFLTYEALRDLKDVVDRSSRDASCRVLILSGMPFSFCEGLDLEPLIGANKVQSSTQLAVAVKDLIESLLLFMKPVVALVRGPASGLGLTLLNHADLVLASTAATFQMPHMLLGCVPEGGATLTLPQTVGSTVAMDMIFRSRILSAEEAMKLGLVTEIMGDSVLQMNLSSRIRSLLRTPVHASETAKSMVKMRLKLELPRVLENEVKLLPRLWLSVSCQESLRSILCNESSSS